MFTNREDCCESKWREKPKLEQDFKNVKNLNKIFSIYFILKIM